MATLTVQEIVRGAGLLPVLSGEGVSGDEFVNTGVEFVYVENDGGNGEVRFTTYRVVDGLAIAKLVVDLTSGQKKYIGPFPTSLYNDAGGMVQITYDASANYLIGIFKLS